MNLKELIDLKAASVAKIEESSDREKVDKFFNQLQDKFEVATEEVSEIRKLLQSSVLADLIKQQQKPATEANAAKDAIETAYKSLVNAFNELEDLYMAIATTEDAKTE